MNHIVLICGRSGCGKSTIIQNIQNMVEHPDQYLDAFDKSDPSGIAAMLETRHVRFPKMYTTRPKRPNESDKEYRFVSEEEFEFKRTQMIHASEYNTTAGIWKYGTVMDYEEWFGKNQNDAVILPINLDGYFQINENIKKWNAEQPFKKRISVHLLYIFATSEDLLIRSIKRELAKPKEKQDFAEILRRYQTETDVNHHTEGVDFNAFYYADMFEKVLDNIFMLEDMTELSIGNDIFANMVRKSTNMFYEKFGVKNHDDGKRFHFFHSINDKQDVLSVNILKTILELDKIEK